MNKRKSVLGMSILALIILAFTFIPSAEAGRYVWGDGWVTAWEWSETLDSGSMSDLDENDTLFATCEDITSATFTANFTLRYNTPYSVIKIRTSFSTNNVQTAGIHKLYVWDYTDSEWDLKANTSPSEYTAYYEFDENHTSSRYWSDTGNAIYCKLRLEMTNLETGSGQDVRVNQMEFQVLYYFPFDPK